MTQVYLSLGSNIEPQRYLKKALAALRADFGDLIVSPVYESLAVGFVGDNFLNLVVAIDTDLSVASLSSLLRDLEEANGRQRQTTKFSSRTLDIDILTYGDAVGVIDGVQLPRTEIERYGFVLRPLADIAAEQRYPVSGISYGAMCEQLLAGDESLWRVRVDL
jgi:2-amino-4-hydroxy-6-hydroxymethyldihydropteridine diphosphokinase